MVMEKYIRDRYHNGILQAAIQAYGITPAQIQLLDGFESFMYAFSREDGDFILRIGHTHRRSIPLILGEVDWINYLAAGGAGVAPAIYSTSRRLVEVIPDGQGQDFLATAFVRAKGGPPRRGAQWNDDLFVKYGRLIGRIHKLSKTYLPADPAWQRPEWDDPINMEITRWLSPVDQRIRDRYAAVRAHLDALPKDPESYGLIHQDTHAGYFFDDDAGNITLFDFDDCVYSWFVYDLAMVVFYAITNREDADEFGQHFWGLFWTGYCQENQLDPVWLQEIPTFLKLREIDLYAILQRDSNMVEIMNNPWTINYLKDRKQRIEQDVPYTNVNFAAVA